VRDRERRSGFSLPADMLALTPPPAQAGGIEGLLQHALRWSDVEWLLGNTRLPLLLKGVVHPEDARQAARLGVAGLIVSNHGGRVLDTVPASAELLPPIAQAVQGDCALLLDGGIRRGTDVLKALALGAQGVLVGRPAIWGLANGGAAGVAHVLRLLLDEFMAAMALCGAGALADIGPDLLAVPPRS
jgi:4-hydroxymandelate oxidase